MTPIQNKILEAARLLVEVREIARIEGAKFRAENNLPIARYYEDLQLDLSDNRTISLEGLLRHIEIDMRSYKGSEVTPEQVNESMRWLMRYVTAKNKVSK